MKLFNAITALALTRTLTVTAAEGVNPKFHFFVDIFGLQLCCRLVLFRRRDDLFNLFEFVGPVPSFAFVQAGQAAIPLPESITLAVAPFLTLRDQDDPWHVKGTG